MTPLVTIAIPFYNSEKTLKSAINSVILQTYKTLEILLIDDGSTDSSLKIAETFLIDPRVKVISDQKNLGLISRLNQIIDLAQGKYIARMDADDLMDFDRISIQVEALEMDLSIDVLGTGIISIDDKNQPIGKRNCDSDVVQIKKLFKNGGNIIHPSLLVKTSWYRQNYYKQGFDRAEDRELFTRTINKSKFKVIPKPLFYYRDIQNMTLDKYLRSYKSERKAIRANWKGRIGIADFINLYLRSILKSLVIRIYFALGKQDTLFKNKNVPLSPLEIERFNFCLNQCVNS